MRAPRRVASRKEKTVKRRRMVSSRIAASVQQTRPGRYLVPFFFLSPSSFLNRPPLSLVFGSLSLVRRLPSFSRRSFSLQPSFSPFITSSEELQSRKKG